MMTVTMQRMAAVALALALQCLWGTLSLGAQMLEDARGNLHINTTEDHQRVFVNGVDVLQSADALLPSVRRACKDATVDTTSMAGFDLGTSKWFRGVYSPDTGKIYGVPATSDSVLIIDPATHTVDNTSITGLAAAFPSRYWASGTVAKDGRIYCPPQFARNVLVIDPVANTVATIGHVEGSDSWEASVLAPDGFIYAVPDETGSVLIIDPDNHALDTTTLGGLPLTSNKWFGAVLAPNGNIYGIPGSSTSVLIIDPVAKYTDITTITGLSDDVNKWRDGVLADNGKIYGIPYRSESVLIIDPSTNTVDTTTLSGLEPGRGKWWAGTLAGNGRIFAVPANADELLIIDVEANTLDTTSVTGLRQGWGATTHSWLGAVYAPNTNQIFAIPATAPHVLIIEPACASL